MGSWREPRDGPERVGESGGTGCNLTLSSWGSCSALSRWAWASLPDSLWTWTYCCPVLGRVLGQPPGNSPARAEHRVSVEHVAESINKGGGWQARAAGALRAMGWRLPGLGLGLGLGFAAAVWANP